jgi:hypothetical protein
MHFITSTKQFAILHSNLGFADGVVGRLPYKPDDGSRGAVVFGVNFGVYFIVVFAAGGVVMVSSVVFSVIVSVTVGFTVVFVVVFVRL